MKLVRRFFEWEVNHPIVVIVIIALITAFFAWFAASEFRIENPTDRLLQKDLPSKIFYDRFSEMFSKDEIILVVIKNKEGVYGEEFIDALTELEEELYGINAKISGNGEPAPIRKIVSLKPVRDRYEKAKEEFEARRKKSRLFKKIPFPSFRKTVEMTRLFSKNLVSEDGNATALTVFVQSHQEEVVQEIQKVIDKTREKYPWEIYQIGTPVIMEKVAATAKGDLKKLSGLTMLLVVVVLFICFRNVRGVLLPGLTCGGAFLWTLGLMGLINRPMTMVTLIIPTLIVAIGNAYALHVVSEFMEQAHSGGSKKSIVTKSLSNLSLPVFLTVATTLVGFASLALNKIDMIREFALFSCFGLISVFLIAVTLVPALLVVMKLPRLKQRKGRQHFIEKVLNALTNFNIRWKSLIYVFMVVLTAVSIYGISRIRVETAVIEFFKKDDEIRINFDDVSETLAGTYPFNIVLISEKPDYFRDPEVLGRIEKLQEFLENIEDIDKTISIADYIKTVNMASRGNPRFQIVPETREEVDKVIDEFPAIFGGDLSDVYITVTPDYTAVNIIGRTAFGGTREFVAAEKKVLEYCRKNFSKDLEVHVSGLPIVIAHSADAITRGQVKSLSLAFICIFVIMTLLFMSVKVGVVAMIPNMVPVMVNFGVMGLFNIPLSSATSLIASIALGIAVDDTIHYLAKYNTEFKKDWNKKRAIRETMLTVGKPIIFTSMTLALGFSVLMISSFQPTILFGMLMVITMTTALFGVLVILPAFLLNTELVTAWDFVALKLGDLPRRRIPLFEGFSKWQVKKLLVAGKLEKFAEGAVVFSEGDMGDTMYAIISGGVDVVKGESGKVTALDTGEVFGEMGIVRHKERTATICTNKPTELLHINDATLRRIQKRFPRIATKFYNNLTKILAERLDTTTRKLFERN